MTALLYPDHPADLAAMAEWQAACARQQEITRITGKTAMERAEERIDAEAKELRRELVKRATRQYHDDPSLLDKIKLGLSDAHPAFIMAAIEQKRGIPWGRIDMLAVLSVNEAGAYTYARWYRRQLYRERVALAAPARPRAGIRVVTENGECVG